MQGLRPRLRLQLMSPAEEDGVVKDQDACAADAAEFFACVADGVSSSPYGGEAARLGVDYARRALLGDFSSDSVYRVFKEFSDSLVELRTGASVMEFTFPAAHSDAMRRYMEDIFREKLHTSYQTTLAAVRLMRRHRDGAWVAFVVWCGDSAVLAFDADGNLRETFPRALTIPSGGRSTQVIPDHFDALQGDGLIIESPRHLVLATDGFYNAFEGPRQLWEWLVRHEGEISTQAVQTLHACLRRRRGDDDITAIWMSVEVEEAHAS